MTGKIIGGVLLIIGTSLGAGMLALPIATAAGGFYHTLALFLVIWAMMTLAAFYVLEVNLWLPANTNLISMAKATLGRLGQLITWISYLLLLYSILSAYTSGGGDLLRYLLGQIHIHMPSWLSTVIFVVLFGSVIFNGVKAVDWANRGLMSIKLIAYLLLVILIAPNIDPAKLAAGHWIMLSSGVMVVVTSFAYSIIVPTLRGYLDSHVNALRITIAIGSLFPLVIYVLWNIAVQGTLASDGSGGLIAMSQSGRAVSQLTQALSGRLHSETISLAAHIFTSICVTTSFLGVALCLSDFMADGLGIKKRYAGKGLIMLVTLLPPLLLVLFYPGIFIIGIRYAGVLCVILLMLLPALMVWSGRYVKKIASGYRVMGGKFFIILEVVVALALLAIDSLS